MDVALKALGALANAASIATASVALWAYFRYTANRKNKRLRLEDHLRTEKAESNRMAISVMDLVAELGMTESEIMDAAFNSSKIKRLATTAMIGAPTRILLSYIGK